MAGDWPGLAIDSATTERTALTSREAALAKALGVKVTELLE